MVHRIGQGREAVGRGAGAMPAITGAKGPRGKETVAAATAVIHGWAAAGAVPAGSVDTSRQAATAAATGGRESIRVFLALRLPTLAGVVATGVIPDPVR